MQRLSTSGCTALILCCTFSGSMWAEENDRFVSESGPESIDIFPQEIGFTSADAQRFVVSGFFEDESASDLTGLASCFSSDVNVVTVDNGRLIPVGNGEAEIVAEFRDLRAIATVTVTQFETPRIIDFRTDVIGALSRGGCNQGACHGSPQGKNGFRLSLRGFDPDIDYSELTRDLYGRRVNTGEPDRSLMLLKATGQVPHEGGRRFRHDDPAFRTLSHWISQGCRDSRSPAKLTRLEVYPSRRRLHRSGPRQRLMVRAHYSDRPVQDVTDYAVFTAADDSEAAVSQDGLVRFESTAAGAVLVRFLDRIETVSLTWISPDPEFEFVSPPVANFVDEKVFARQRELQLQPAALCSDAVFLRRVCLDLTGGIPTPDDAREFLDSSDPDKRGKLIDRLLEQPGYANFQALHWADVMRGNRGAISERGVHNFHRYLVAGFAGDRPFVETASEILTSLGNTIHEPAANFYRISRTPVDAAESFSQLFLGVRVQCAKCHNHPYESISQRDYYGLAAYFARVKLKGQRFGLDDETVFLARSGEVKFPQTGEIVSPAAFGALGSALQPDEDRRQRLAMWLSDPANPFFARSVVNRVWQHMMGQGIVEPVDDFRDSNLPSSPELLDALAEYFVASGYRFRPLIRTIVNSSTYQLSADSPRTRSPRAASPERYFTRAVVKMLSAEQLIDAIAMATGIPERFGRYPVGTKAIELAEGDVDHRFLQAFTKPIRDVACDCARETDPTLAQVMHLLNNAGILSRIDSEENRLAQWLDARFSDERIVESLYLATLSRRPNTEELKLAGRYVAAAQDRTEAFRDLQHALLNSNEFLMRH